MATKVERKSAPSFWKSSAGVATGLAVGAAAVAGVMALGKNASAQSSGGGASPPVTGVQPGPKLQSGQASYENFQPGYYLFNVLAPSDPTAALSTAGFGQIQAAPDPYQVSNWLVSAYWTSPAGATTVLDGGPGQWQINGMPSFLGATAPPVPQPYSGLAAGAYYAFSIRTSFLQSAASVAQVIQNMLGQSGWSNVLVIAAADQSATPDTWNIAAQWNGSGSSQTQDMPPLWLFVTPPTGGGAQPLPQPSSAMP